MISAIAARKAANAANGAPSPKPVSVAPDTPPASAPPSKRKHVSDGNTAPAPVKKRKKKLHRKSEPGKSQRRYFQEPDFFQGQDAVVPINSEPEEEDEEDELEIILDDAAPVLPTTRSYSPSRPIDDSSDEDEEIPEEPAASSSAPNTPPLLSTFAPIENQNLFYLTDGELSSLGFAGPESESSAATIVSLQPDETLTLIGTYRVTVLHGSLSLYGAILHPSRETYDVFAPRSSPLPPMQALPSHLTASSTSTSRYLSSAPQRIHSCISGENTVLLLQELCTNVEGLGRVCRIFDGVFKLSPRQRHLEPMVADTPDLRLSTAEMITHQSKYVSPFHLPPSWESALDSAIDNADEDSPGIYLIKGPKKLGKSSFARALTNRLLSCYQRVAYLECDLGQSEFTPGGMVALNVIQKPITGPPFTHPTLPTRAHFIGGTTPRTSPSHYLSAIQALAEHYRLDIRTPIDSIDPVDDLDAMNPSAAEEHDNKITHVIPLVVNTMGWAKGLGADLTRKIEETIEPTEVFEFEFAQDSPGASGDGGWSNNTSSRRSLPSQTNGFSHAHGLSNESSAANRTGKQPRSYKLTPAPLSPSSMNYSPADHRTLAILSYMHAVFPDSPSVPSSSSSQHSLPHSLLSGTRQITARAWNTSLPLCAQLPYEVDVRQAFDGVFLAGSGGEDVVVGEIERVLGGALVGMVSCEPGTLDATSIVSHPNPDSNPTSVSKSASTLIPYTQNSTPPSSLTSHAHGLALVRSVAAGGSHVHILTPLPPSLFSATRVLVKGEMELPVWGMLDYRSSDRDVDREVPFLQWGKGEGLGAEKRRVRRNLMRKAQM